jgi:hypothetical protein
LLHKVFLQFALQIEKHHCAPQVQNPEGRNRHWILHLRRRMTGGGQYPSSLYFSLYVWGNDFALAVDCPEAIVAGIQLRPDFV